MKVSKYTVIVILTIFTVNIQCGVIDNIYGKVKNTTNALGRDVKNVWSYSKSVVGIETPADNRTEEEKRGLFGGMFHTTREKIHHIRNYFWNTDANTNDAGLFGNMYNRVTNSLSKAKGLLSGENQTTRPPSDSEKLLQQTVEKLFFGNGTRRVHGKAFQDVVESLRRKLQDVRNEIEKQGQAPLNYGEGLMDVRKVAINIVNNINDNTPGIANNVYDAVEENLDKARDKSDKSFKIINNEGDRMLTSLSNGVDNAAHQLNVIKDNVVDAAVKEKELLQNNISTRTQKIKDSVKNTVEDAKRLVY